MSLNYLHCELVNFLQKKVRNSSQFNCTFFCLFCCLGFGTKILRSDVVLGQVSKSALHIICGCYCYANTLLIFFSFHFTAMDTWLGVLGDKLLQTQFCSQFWSSAVVHRHQDRLAPPHHHHHVLILGVQLQFLFKFPFVERKGMFTTSYCVVRTMSIFQPSIRSFKLSFFFHLGFVHSFIT